MNQGANARNLTENHSPFPQFNEHRSKILYDATIQFCAPQRQIKKEGVEEYKTLFYSFIKEVDLKTRKLISSHLSRNRNTPRSIAFFLAMEPIDIAAPFLLVSQVFWEKDLLQLVGKLSSSHLLMMARRSDITPAVASALLAKDDNLINKVLSKNPTLRLNQLAHSQISQNRSIPPAYQYQGENKKPDNKNAVNELLRLAQVAVKDKNIAVQPSLDEALGRTAPFPDRLLSVASGNNRHAVARELADQTGIELPKVEKIVVSENTDTLVVFLKGLQFNSEQVSDLLVKLKFAAADNFSMLNRCIDQFNRFSVAECRDLLKNMGARSLAFDTNRQVSQETLPQVPRPAPTRQIPSTHVPPMFGNKRSA